MGRRSGTTTIAEVAAHARVSPATVSRIMNGRFVGDPEVARRVQASAAELGYVPSPLARSLALGRTRTVAFVVPDLSNPAFQAVLSGLTKAASKDGYRVLVADSAESPGEEAALATEVRRRCDSIVLCAPRMPDADLAEIAGALHPLVVVNRPAAPVDAPLLSIDYRGGIRALARHLHALGHRRFVYLAGPESSASNAHRLAGLDDFARDAGDVHIERIPGGVRPEDGVAAASAVLATGATAALAFNDLVAVGLVNGLADAGARVPEDVSVTGFDDIPFARFMAPALTTASVPHEELGAEAWRRLHAVIEGEAPGHNLMFEPRLELRASTAAAPTG